MLIRLKRFVHFRVPADPNFNWVTTKFNDTLKMSTYLLAIIVSDFVCKSDKAKTPLSGSVDVSACARPTAIDELDYPLEAGVKILEFFEGYYNTIYPFPKCGKFNFPIYMAMSCLSCLMIGLTGIFRPCRCQGLQIWCYGELGLGHLRGKEHAFQ